MPILFPFGRRVQPLVRLDLQRITQSDEISVVVEDAPSEVLVTVEDSPAEIVVEVEDCC